MRLVAIVIAVAVSGVLMKHSLDAGAASQTLIPTQREMELTLHKVGLSPEVLTAAGCSAAEAADIVRRARTHLVSNGSWSQRRKNLEIIASAKREISRLRRVVRAGQGRQQEIAALASARSTLAAAESTQVKIEEGVYEAAVAGLDERIRLRLNTLIANAHWGLPIELQAVNRSEAEWVALRNALAAERIAVAREEAVDADVAEMLSSARRAPACSWARANLVSRLSAIKVAYELAIRDN